MIRNWSKNFRRGNPVYQLNLLASVMVDSVEDRFVEHVGLDVRTIRVLRLIADDPGITFAEITGMAALERSLASRLIQNLVKGGLVERRNFETDARRFGLYITEAGQVARKRADALTQIGLTLVFEKLGPDEIAAFVATMEKLADWIDSDEFEHKVEDAYGSLTFDD
ncbi:MAG: winged helix-turn-helix transcriptional regulator [Rhodobacteraceae bacterium]|nr:winged helix-turn-helix transcriptional regulator [Paracoccaceae bacterium]